MRVRDIDIPVLAVTAVGKEMARDARYLALACRIAAELGAHIVKTYYCKDFKKVVESCPNSNNYCRRQKDIGKRCTTIDF